MAILFIPWLTLLIAPGFRNDSEQMRLAVELAQICFPYLIFKSSTAMLSGVLSSLNRFATTAGTSPRAQR